MLLLHLGHHLLHRLGHEALALAADGVLLGGLSRRGEVVHQGVHHVVVARLLEVGHDDVAGISLGCGACLADQAGRPQPQHLVLARARFEFQLLVMLEFLLKGVLALVERRHLGAPVGLVAAGYSSTSRPFHPMSAMATSSQKGRRWNSRRSYSTTRPATFGSSATSPIFSGFGARGRYRSN